MTPNWPYLHTLINHFPIVLTVVGTVAVLLALLYSRRGLWLFALGSLTLAGITVYPAWFSGEEAAGVVKHAWYIPKGAISEHAQAADVTMWLLLLMGLASLIAWASIVRARDAFAPARWLRIIVSVLAVAAFVAVSYTGYRGGQIVVDSAILTSPTPPVLAAPAAGAAGAAGQPTLTPSQQLPPPPAAGEPLGQQQQPIPPVQPQVVPQQPPVVPPGATRRTSTRP